MQTKSIARCGMLCALYGVFLFFNSMTGLFLETTFPVVFALPVLWICLHETRKLSLSAFIAMALLTLMLSGITTWIIALSMLLCGKTFGLCLKGGHSIYRAAVLCMVLMTVCSYLQMSVLAGLFGFDGQAEREFFSHLTLFVSWDGFLWILSVFLSLLEVIPLFCICILMSLDGRVAGGRAFRLDLHLEISPLWAAAAAAGAVCLCLEFFHVLLFPAGWRDLIAFLSVISFGLVLLDGSKHLFSIYVNSLKSKSSGLGAFFFVMMVIFPGLNLVPFAFGFANLTKKGIRFMRKRYEKI